MSQVFDLTPSHSTQIENASFKSPDISLTLVVTMCFVGIALSFVSLILPGWAFQPYDVTNFPLP